jgi:hypothetical protein
MSDLRECCKQTYLCCSTCGASRKHQTRADAGETCGSCHNGIIKEKTSYICCQRHHHHLGSRCTHCGAIG